MLSSFIFNANEISHEDLMRRRALAEAMLQRGQTGIASNLGEGIGQFGQALAGRLKLNSANSAISANRAKAYKMLAPAFGGTAATAKGGATFKPYKGGGQPEIVSYITEAATKRGIDPKIALAVANAEGLKGDPREGWQSRVMKNGKRERSYGPFQLYIDGGLGNEFMKTTGLDPRDPNTVRQQIDFALDAAAKGGWGPWYGAKNIGLGQWDGINKAGGPNIQPASAPPPGMQADGAPAPMGTAMTGFPPQPAPMAPQTPQPASAPPQMAPEAMAPQAPMTAYQRMMQQGIAKGEAGGLQGPVGRQQMASVMGNGSPGGGLFSGALAGLGMGAPAQPPAAPEAVGMEAAPTAAGAPGGSGRLGQLSQFIASGQMDWLPEQAQKMVWAEYERELEALQPKDPKYHYIPGENGDQYRIDENDPNSKPTLIYDAPDKPAEPPKTRERIDGTDKVFEEWDGTKYVEVSRGPAYKTTPDTVINNGSGVKEEKIFDEASKQKDAAKSAASGLAALNEAERALPGAITGAGADAQLALQKVAEFFGVGDTKAIVDTETFRSAIAPQIAAMLKATTGTTQVSNADREFAEKAAGGSIALDKGSIQRLVRIMRAANSEIVRDYNQRMDQVYPSDTMARERALLGVPNVPKVYASPIGPKMPAGTAPPTETAPDKGDREGTKLTPGTTIKGLDALPEGHEAYDKATETYYKRRGGKVYSKKKGGDWRPM